MPLSGSISELAIGEEESTYVESGTLSSDGVSTVNAISANASVVWADTVWANGVWANGVWNGLTSNVLYVNGAISSDGVSTTDVTVTSIGWVTQYLGIFDPLLRPDAWFDSDIPDHGLFDDEWIKYTSGVTSANLISDGVSTAILYGASLAIDSVIASDGVSTSELSTSSIAYSYLGSDGVSTALLRTSYTAGAALSSNGVAVATITGRLSANSSISSDGSSTSDLTTASIATSNLVSDGASTGTLSAITSGIGVVWDDHVWANGVWETGVWSGLVYIPDTTGIFMADGVATAIVSASSIANTELSADGVSTADLTSSSIASASLSSDGVSTVIASPGDSSVVWDDHVWANGVWETGVWAGLIYTPVTTCALVSDGTATSIVVGASSITANLTSDGVSTAIMYAADATPSTSGALVSDGAATAIATIVDGSASVTITDINAYISGSDLVVEFNTTIDLSGGWIGFAYSVNSTPPVFTKYVEGAVTNQSITVPLAELGAESGDTIYIDAGYSDSDPPSIWVWAFDEGTAYYEVIVSTDTAALSSAGVSTAQLYASSEGPVYADLSSDGLATSIITAQSSATSNIYSDGIGDAIVSGSLLVSADISSDGISTAIYEMAEAPVSGDLTSDGVSTTEVTGESVASADLSSDGIAVAYASLESLAEGALGSVGISTAIMYSGSPIVPRRHEGKRRHYDEEEEFIGMLTMALPHLIQGNAKWHK